MGLKSPLILLSFPFPHSRDDIKLVRETRDPILILRNRLIEAGLATDDELKSIEKEVRAQVQKEVDEALKADPTPLDLLTKHIYIEDVKNVRGCDPFTQH